MNDCDPSKHRLTDSVAEEVFCDLYNGLWQELYFYLVYRTGNAHQAKDLIQDIFLGFWTMRQRYTTIVDLKAYLFRMARNACFEMGRAEQSQRSYEEFIEQQTVKPENLTQSICDQRELQRKLQQAILLLTPHRRAVFVLSRLEGWPRKKIATALGVSACTVKATLQNALGDIRKYTGFVPAKNLKRWQKSKALQLFT